jgi:hypothetical protein
MKVSSSRFALICIVLVGTLCALHYFTFELLAEKPAPTYFLLTYVILGLMYWLSYHWVLRAMDKSPRQFVNTFMMVSVFRMLLSLIFLIPVLMKNKETGLGKFIAIYFVVGYFIFLVTEIAILFNVSKRKG